MKEKKRVICCILILIALLASMIPVIILTTETTDGSLGTTEGKETKKTFLLVVASDPHENGDDVEVHSLNNETLPTCLQFRNKSGLEKMTYPKQSKVNFPPLPIGFNGHHCLISLENTDNDFLLLMFDYSYKTLIYRSTLNEWVQMADMPPDSATERAICGPVRSRIGGPVEKVVVAFQSPVTFTNHSHSAEIYNVKENTWESMDNLPIERQRLFKSIVVPYEKTFLVVGGKFGYSSRPSTNKKVFKFEESTKSWITMPFQISVGIGYLRRTYVMWSIVEKAMLVSPDMFPGC